MASRRRTLALILACAWGLTGVATGGGGAAQAASEAGGRIWLSSYRDAYQVLIRFEKYGKAKQLIQQHYQIVARDGNGAIDGVHLSVSSPTLQIDVPLDAAGRAVLPLLKAAYDENAELTLSGRAGQYLGRVQVSIAARPDGLYEMAELRAACEQVLGFLRYRNDVAAQGRKCSAVRFSYPRSGPEPLVRLRTADGAVRNLPAVDGAAFWGDKTAQFRTVSVPFSTMNESAKVVTSTAPLAIAAWFE